MVKPTIATGKILEWRRSDEIWYFKTIEIVEIFESHNFAWARHAGGLLGYQLNEIKQLKMKPQKKRGVKRKSI